MSEVRIGGERAGGYLVSALIFAGITAAWAYIVRDDDFYQWTELFQFRLPIATVFYVTVMPLAGFWAGRWRYQANGGAGAGWVAKVIARTLNFLYSHILIVLFTSAMMTEFLFAWDISDSVREIDDNMFEIAERFAPWLSAYLFGFNLGRAWGITRTRNAVAGGGSRASFNFGNLKRRGGKRSGDDQGALFDGDAPELEKRWPSEEEIVFADKARKRTLFSRLR